MEEYIPTSLRKDTALPREEKWGIGIATAFNAFGMTGGPLIQKLML